MNAPAITVAARPPRYRRRRSLPLIFVTCAVAGATLAAVLIAAAMLSHAPAGAGRNAGQSFGRLFTSATLADFISTLRDDHELSAYGGPLPEFVLPAGATAGVRYMQGTSVDGHMLDFDAFEFDSQAAAKAYAAIAGGTARGRLVLVITGQYGYGDNLAAIFDEVAR